VADCCVDGVSRARQTGQKEEVTQTIENREARTVPTIRKRCVPCQSKMADIVASAPCLGKGHFMAAIRMMAAQEYY
jgi:hypothetical protein